MLVGDGRALGLGFINHWGEDFVADTYEELLIGWIHFQEICVIYLTFECFQPSSLLGHRPSRSI